MFVDLDDNLDLRMFLIKTMISLSEGLLVLLCIVICNVVNKYIHNLLNVMRWWFSGKINGCHPFAPGSIPGRRIFFAVTWASSFINIYEFLEYS